MLTKATLAFLFGGGLSVIAQILIDKTSLTPAKILVSFVLFGVLLGSLNLYEPLFNTFGAGASLPLIGYGGGIARGVREAIEKEGFLGVIKGSFCASAVGCTASLIFGFLAAIFFKSKPKKL